MPAKTDYGVEFYREDIKIAIEAIKKLGSGTVKGLQ